MEPVSTAVAISGVVGYLAKTLKENKKFTDFTTDFTSATVNWIRPLFLKDDKDDQPNEVLKKLKETPDSEARRKAAVAQIEAYVEDNPDAREWLAEMYKEIQQKKQKNNQEGSVIVTDSERVSVGDLTSGGNINQNFGDAPKENS